MEAELTKVQSKLDHLRALRDGDKRSNFFEEASEPLTPPICSEKNKMYDFDGDEQYRRNQKRKYQGELGRSMENSGPEIDF